MPKYGNKLKSTAVQKKMVSPLLCNEETGQLHQFQLRKLKNLKSHQLETRTECIKVITFLFQ